MDAIHKMIYGLAFAHTHIHTNIHVCVIVSNDHIQYPYTSVRTCISVHCYTHVNLSKSDKFWWMVLLKLALNLF